MKLVAEGARFVDLVLLTQLLTQPLTTPTRRNVSRKQEYLRERVSLSLSLFLFPWGRHRSFGFLGGEKRERTKILKAEEATRPRQTLPLLT